jgi:uncharacterized membrane protein
VGIILGRILDLPPLAMLYLGREFNLLFWALLGYSAVRSASAIGRPLVLILLMPMSLYVASTLSADAPTNAFAAAYTAMICSLISRKDQTVNLPRFFMLLLLSLAVCLCKTAYAPLLGLVLLIPSDRFGGPSRYAAKLAILIAVCAAAAWAWDSMSSSLDTQIRLSNDVSARAQIQLLEQNPLHFAPILVETFQKKGWTYLREYIGLIGWYDRYVPTAFVVSYLVFLLLACVPGEDSPVLPPVGKVAAAVVPSVTVSFLIIALLDYLYWTSIGSPFIDGIHGRYLIPLSPAIALLLSSAMRRLGLGFHAKSDGLNLTTAIISVLSCGYFLAMVWNRYYG